MAKYKSKSFGEILINLIGLILLFICIAIIGLFIYFKTAGSKYVPTAVTSTYVTQVTDPLTGEDLPFIMANVYSNKNGKGEKVTELLFNTYSGTSKSVIYSRGFQLVTTSEGKQTIYAYDKQGKLSWETGHEYEWGDPLITDIEGKTYAVKLDGTYVVRKTDGWKIFRTAGFLGLNLLWEGTDFEQKTTVKYTFKDFLIFIEKMITSVQSTTGDYTLPIADLADYLHIYEENSQGQFTTKVGDGTFINSYFTIQTHFDNRGMTMARQSMFEKVANDPNFNLTGLKDEKDFHSSTTIIRIDEKSFKSITRDEKVYIAINPEVVTSLGYYSNIEVEITINVDEFDGIDYFGLMGLKLRKLNIKATTQKDFEVLNGALKDTGLNFEDVQTTNVKLINKEG